MRPQAKNGNNEDMEIVALRALAWILSDDVRAERLLALTGLAADELRTRAGDATVLAATMDFLCSHEPDLIACARALAISPTDLASIGRRLLR